MLKRDLYSEFLAAGRKLKDGAEGEDERSEYLRLRDKVLLFASNDVKGAVAELPENLSSVDDRAWNQLIEKLNEHSRDPDK